MYCEVKWRFAFWREHQACFGELVILEVDGDTWVWALLDLADILQETLPERRCVGHLCGV